MAKYIITDWTGRVCFNCKSFSSSDKALSFLEQHDPEGLEEYSIEERGEIQPLNLLHPNDPRAGFKNCPVAE